MADHHHHHTRTERLEFAAALLLVLATVPTAWSSYQASRWHGEQAEAQGSATAKRVESTRASGVANRQGQIDVQLFIQWVDANQQGDRELAGFYRDRFTPRFKPAFRAWLATKPLDNPAAPSSPFVMPQYKVAAAAQAERLEAQASAASEEAKEDIQRADNYVLAVVLFAACLFLGGLSLRLRTDSARVAILGCGYAIFVGAAIWIATSPVSVSV